MEKKYAITVRFREDLIKPLMKISQKHSLRPPMTTLVRECVLAGMDTIQKRYPLK